MISICYLRDILAILSLMSKELLAQRRGGFIKSFVGIGDNFTSNYTKLIIRVVALTLCILCLCHPITQGRYVKNNTHHLSSYNHRPIQKPAGVLFTKRYHILS